MAREVTPAAHAGIERLVLETVAELCRLDAATIDAEATLREIGLDSLSLMSLAALVEGACGMKLEERAAARLFEAERVADLIAILREARADEPIGSFRRSRR